MSRPAARPTVYLAGPMVFLPDPAATFDVMRAICARHGLEGVAPLDAQFELAGLAPGHDTLLAIVRADRDLMQRLDAGLFCLDPFRRCPEMDPGTAVEIGYMHALGKPMAGWTRDGRPYPVKVADYFHARGERLLPTAANAIGGTSGDLRDPDGMLVHSEGMLQNGMAPGFIELAGGAVFADADWEVAFDAAARHLAGQLGCAPGGTQRA